MYVGEDRKGRSSTKRAGLQPSINCHHRHHQYLSPLSPLFHHAVLSMDAYSLGRGGAGHAHSARSIQEAHARDRSLMSKSVRNDIHIK